MSNEQLKADRSQNRMNVWFKDFLSNKIVIVFVISIILFVLGQMISPGFSSFSNIMNVLNISAMLGCIALAQTIVVISGNEGIDLSIGATLSLSACIAAQVMDGQDSKLILAVFVVLVVGFLIGLVNGVGISYFKIPPLVMTLAMASVVYGISLVYTNGQPKGSASSLLKSLGNERTIGIPNLVYLWAIVAIIALFFLSRSRWGKILYALGTNYLTAELSGVRTKVFRTFVYATAGAISAFGGVLLLSYTGTPYLDIGSTYVIPSIIAVVIGGIALRGGIGNYMGVIAGAILLTVLSSILITINIGEGGRQIVYGSVLLFLLIVYARERKN
ncbi:MAG: ABC transporter permease [Bacilli bacterium]